jgi:hypothetical protein
MCKSLVIYYSFISLAILITFEAKNSYFHIFHAIKTSFDETKIKIASLHLTTQSCSIGKE